MTDEMVKKDTLASPTNCGVCARPLVYTTEAEVRVCSLCGQEGHTLIYCPAGHYVCDACHSKAAIVVLREVLDKTRSHDPMAILEQVMGHPSVPMHGPEHHYMVPAIIVAAVRNAGYPVPEGAIEKALDRASKVPGGWCGSHGDCGAAVGVGIAVSVLTGATPLTGKERSLGIGATASALGRMLDDQPRCCKRASRTAVKAATDFLNERLGLNLPQAERQRCTFSLRNRECSREQCPYYGNEPS